MTASRRITFLTSKALVLPGALAVAACGGGGAAGSSSPAKTSSGQAATVGVANSRLGKILVDSRGRAREWLALSPAGDEVTNQPSSSGSTSGGY